MDNKVIFSNLVWRFSERFGAKFVEFIVSIVLARILSPDDYGLIALVAIFIALMNVFVDSGIASALIQKKDADELDFSTAFYFNFFLCVILYSFMYITAPVIAEFYNNLALIPIIRVLSLNIIVSGLKNVQQAYVSRNMLFKKFFFATLGGTLAAAALGIGMACTGFGIWALVAQQLANVTIDTVILWCTVKWRPKKIFSLVRLKRLLHFGWKLLVSGLLNTTYENLRSLVIGRKYTATDLAYYNQGHKFPSFIVTNVNSSIDSVLLPALSFVQEDRERVKNMTRRAIKVSTYVMAPLMMGLAFTAETLVQIILTEKWLPCVLFLRIFCVTFMFYPIHTANLNAVNALGRSDLFLKLEIWKKGIGVVALLLTMNISVEAMAYSSLTISLCSQLINTWPNRKLLHYSYIDQIKDILPEIILAFFMGIVVYPMKWLGLPCVIQILCQIMIGAVFYIVGSIIMKLDSFQYMCQLFVPIIKRFKRKI